MKRPLAVWALACATACSAERRSTEGPAVAVNPEREPPQANPSPAVAVAAQPPSDVSVPELADQYLVLGEDLVLFSRGSTTSRRLAERPSDALYDAAAELVWVRRGGELQVLDVRANALQPISLFGGLPEGGHFEVRHRQQTFAALQPESSCDHGNVVSLDWTSDPGLVIFEGGTPRRLAPGVSGRRWLTAEWARPSRALLPRSHFESSVSRVSLPKSALRCDDEKLCGSALPLGASGLELVLVQSQWGADCNHYACLLHNPATKLFATPPVARAWGAAATTAPGTCGPFLFHRDTAWFLVGNALCGPDGQCQALEGRGLGWLLPGPIVGERSIDF
jgi:hypothetical protein